MSPVKLHDVSSNAGQEKSMSDVLLKPLVSADLPKLRDLHSKILPVQYPYSFFLQLLVIPTRVCFVAYTEGNPVGFISAAIRKSLATDISKRFPVNGSHLDADPSRPCLEILTLGVLPPYQQCGLARQLLMRAVDAIRESCAFNSQDRTVIFANVSTSNTRALKFYERMGMVLSSDVIANLYRTISSGSRDAFVVVGTF